MLALTTEIFRGLSAFPITPAYSDGRVDTVRLALLLSRLRGAGVASVGLLGSTGTYPYLSRHERKRAVEAAVACLGGQIPVIVGVGALRTDEAEALSRDAEKAGANGLLLAPVSYTPLLGEEVYQHFQSVAQANGLSLCIYNSPSTTHFTFGADLIARLAETPGIIALKNPAGPPDDVAAEIRDLRARLLFEIKPGAPGPKRPHTEPPRYASLTSALRSSCTGRSRSPHGCPLLRTPPNCTGSTAIGRYTLVAAGPKETPIGFSDIAGNGHIRFLYVDPDHAGRGGGGPLSLACSNMHEGAVWPVCTQKPANLRDPSSNAPDFSASRARSMRSQVPPSTIFTCASTCRERT